MAESRQPRTAMQAHRIVFRINAEQETGAQLQLSTVGIVSRFSQ
jgi:hypothetical protein